MKRRRFLQFPIAAFALANLAHGKEASAGGARRVDRGFRVGAKKGRNDLSMDIMGGRFDLKVSGQDTGGELCIYDTFRSSKGGPPLHRHYQQDEWFYVIRGEFVVQVADERVSLGAGDSAFAPRRVPHSFAMTSEGEGQMLVLFQPAGSMEDFFATMQRLGSDVSAGKKLPPSVWEAHGMELLGPPLSY